MDNQISTMTTRINDPVIEIGENRYLRHYVYEIFHENVLSGYVFCTRYFYRSAAKDKVLRSWLAQRDSYMEHNQKFLLEETSYYSHLPIALSEAIPDTAGEILLLDEVTVTPDMRLEGIEERAIRDLKERWDGVIDSIIVPDFGPMARFIKGVSIDPGRFWSELGFSLTSNGFMVDGQFRLGVVSPLNYPG